MEHIYCYTFVEDIPSAEVVRKIVDIRNSICANSLFFHKGFPSVMGGYGDIKNKVPAFLKMAQQGYHTFALTDLDAEECAPELIRQWFSDYITPVVLPKEVIFRVAVREVESWLLADRDAFARFMRIPKTHFEEYPDSLEDPKQHLFSVIQEKGSRTLHEEMLPRGSAHIGPLYNEKICQFINNKWSPLRAAAKSPSLKRAMEALKKL